MLFYVDQCIPLISSLETSSKRTKKSTLGNEKSTISTRHSIMPKPSHPALE